MKVKLSLRQQIAWWIGSAIVEVQEFIDTVDMVKKGKAAIEIEDGIIVPEPNAKWFVEHSITLIADTCRVADKEHRPLTDHEMRYTLAHLKHTVKDLEERIGRENLEALHAELDEIAAQ